MSNIACLCLVTPPQTIHRYQIAVLINVPSKGFESNRRRDAVPLRMRCDFLAQARARASADHGDGGDGARVNNKKTR